MSAPATHPCDACGGRGVTVGRPPVLADGTIVAISHPIVCPVCLGAGHFSDMMPARDAVADAETLRLLTYNDFSGPVQDLNHCLTQIFFARGRGTHRACAMAAARAAFRAVPGLRED